MSLTWKPGEAHRCCYSHVCLLAFRTYHNQTRLCVVWWDQEASCVSRRQARVYQWLWSHACGHEGEHLCISAAYRPCMSTMSTRASHRVTKILLLATENCLFVFLMKPSFCLLCLLYLHSPTMYCLTLLKQVGGNQMQHYFASPCNTVLIKCLIVVMLQGEPM